MLLKKDNDRIILFKEPVFKVVELMFNYPNRTFHIRELAKETRFSTTAIVKAVNDLKRFRIIKVEKTNLTTNVKADLESEVCRFYKLVSNLYRLERYGLIWVLKETYKPEAISIFGSFAKGEDIEESDIDILIITSKKVYTNNYIDEWERIFKRKINLHILPSLEKSSSEFKNAVANGIILYGYLKVI